MKHSFRRSFRHAADGIKYCIRSERNFRAHVVCMLYVFFFAGFYDFSRAEMVYLVLLCASVLSCEMLNTAIERIVNMQAKNYDLLAKAAKDISSGAVFVLAAAAVVSGAILFFDPAKIAGIFWFFVENSVYGLLFLLSVALAVLFILKK